MRLLKRKHTVRLLGRFLDEAKEIHHLRIDRREVGEEKTIENK